MAGQAVMGRQHVYVHAHVYVIINLTNNKKKTKAIPATVPSSASVPKVTKVGSKIHQVGVQSPLSWASKHIKISIGRNLKEHLGPSWSQEAPRPLQRAPRENWARWFWRFLQGSLALRPTQNLKKNNHFYNICIDRLYHCFGSNLAPKTCAK